MSADLRTQFDMVAQLVVHGHGNVIISQSGTMVLRLAWIEVSCHCVACLLDTFCSPLLVEWLAISIARHTCHDWLKQAQWCGNQAEDGKVMHLLGGFDLEGEKLCVNACVKLVLRSPSPKSFAVVYIHFGRLLLGFDNVLF